MNRKIPTRKCIGCGELKEKNQLVRIVRSKEGEISLDMTGKKNGNIGHSIAMSSIMPMSTRF